MSNPYPSSLINDTTTAAIMYSPRTSTDDLFCPLSPASSLKGIYVRSRPTSMEGPAEHLNFDFGGFYQAPFNKTVQHGDQSADHPLPSNENESILTPVASLESSHVSSVATSVYSDEEYIQKNAARRTAETRARVKALNEGHARVRKHYTESISPSVKTTASKNTVISLIPGRKGDREATYRNIEEAPELKDQTRAQTRAQKKLSIPLVSRVTQRVYGVFHRKAHSTPQSIQVVSCSPDNSINGTAQAALIQDLKPAAVIRSSSISMFTGKRRPTTDSQQEPPQRRSIFSQQALSSIRRNKNSFPAAPNTVSLTSSSLAIENRARLRRSISFAGFFDLPELDDELDEATAEATQVANKTSVMVRWANLQGQPGCDLDGVDSGYVFERNVE